MKYTLSNIENKTVLIAALDWGMGHTTRCVSIIKTLISKNNTVLFAGNQKQTEFIHNDFPFLKTVSIEGYNITLDSTKSTYFQLAIQSSKFAKAIKSENKWLTNFVTNNTVDLIISDNRYGFYHKTIPSVIITHQLSLQLPSFKTIVNKQIATKIEKFTTCWIPDTKNHTYAGELSKGNLTIPIHFIGLLNRFQKLNLPEKHQLLVILSGPEPERSNFLNFAIDYVQQNKVVNAVFIGVKTPNYASFENPTTNQLEQLIAESNTIFSRAGYTTIMEMIALNKKAILIPTKGQFEQVYLAQFTEHKSITFLNQPD